MAYKGPLNKRQLELLRRVVSHEYPVTSHDSALKTTVYALRSRGLVETTPRAKGEWKAFATQAGEGRCAVGSNAVDSKYLRKERCPDITAAELVARVQSASGGLRLPDLSNDERGAWRRAIHSVVNGEALPTVNVATLSASNPST